MFEAPELVEAGAGRRQQHGIARLGAAYASATRASSVPASDQRHGALPARPRSSPRPRRSAARRAPCAASGSRKRTHSPAPCPCRPESPTGRPRTRPAPSTWHPRWWPWNRYRSRCRSPGARTPADAPPPGKVPNRGRDRRVAPTPACAAANAAASTFSTLWPAAKRNLAHAHQRLAARAPARPPCRYAPGSTLCAPLNHSHAWPRCVWRNRRRPRLRRSARHNRPRSWSRTGGAWRRRNFRRYDAGPGDSA
jgi:hypothetical protein